MLGPPMLFSAIDLNQSTLFHWCINCSPLYTNNHLKWLTLICSSIGTIPILKKISSFRISKFLIFSLIQLNILILTTLILWACCFLNIRVILLSSNPWTQVSNHVWGVQHKHIELFAVSVLPKDQSAFVTSQAAPVSSPHGHTRNHAWGVSTKVLSFLPCPCFLGSFIKFTLLTW